MKRILIFYSFQYVPATLEHDLETAFTLFSRARRLLIQDSLRRDAREVRISQLQVNAQVLNTLDIWDCKSLVGHSSSQILSVIADPIPPQGRLLKRICRVRLDDHRYYIFTLTRQSRFDGGDPQDCDGYEECWFIWSINPEKGGKSKDISTYTPEPQRQLVPC